MATRRVFDKVDAHYRIPAHGAYPVERYLCVSGSFISTDARRRMCVGWFNLLFAFLLPAKAGLYEQTGFCINISHHPLVGQIDIFVENHLQNWLCARLIVASQPWHRCGRGGQWEVALALLNETRKYGPSATASIYVATAQACARAGKWEEATDLMEVR